jgi:DNA-damage-inducible protein J
MSETNTVIRSRIDPEVKNEASKILRSMGLTLSEGIRLFLYQIIAQKKLPFSVKTPNTVTIKAMESADNEEVEPTTIEQISKDWDTVCEQ